MLQPTVQPNQIAERLIRHLTPYSYEPIRFADSRPARVFPCVSFGTALTNVTSVISAYGYDRPRSVEKQSIVVVSPLVEDQVADVIDDVLKLLTMLVIQHNSAYGNVPGLFSPYKIGLDAPG